MKIIVADCSWNSIDIEKKYLPPNAEVIGCQCRTEEEVICACRDADAVLAEYAPITGRALGTMKKCKIISQMAIGYDNVEIKAAQELKIAIANVPGYCLKDVADHTMALILSSKRNIVIYDREVREKKWDQNNAPPMQRLETLTLGLIGFGGIAQEVAIRAQGFGMKVLAYDPYVSKDVIQKRNAKSVEIAELLNGCDIISCHLPLTPATKGFINKSLFCQMKKNPLFVNTSRGKVVNEGDLISALKDGILSAAALDVLDKEPPDFHSELLHMDNVIITPHAGFLSETALEEVRRRAALNITDFFANKWKSISFVK